MSDGGEGVEALAFTIDHLRRDVQAARESADARVLIATATGILVERGHGGPAEAARHLRQLADAAGMPPLEVAADIVHATARDRLSEALPLEPPSPAEAPGHRASVLRLRSAEAVALSDDPQAAAEALLSQALAPLGCTALAIWRPTGDGSLSLAGHAGFAAAEAEQWRYVPPGVGTLPQRALEAGSPGWFEVLPPATPGIGRREGTAGARATVPALLGGRTLGVLELCWPARRAALSPGESRQLDVLADLCAHTLADSAVTGADPVGASYAGTGPLAALADALLDPALVLRPHFDRQGGVGDFLISHVNQRFDDMAGGIGASITGLRLLEVYPLAAREGDLYDRVRRVHSTGEPFRAERMPLAALRGSAPLPAMAAVGIGRYGEEVLLSWRAEDEAARIGGLLDHVQRLGRIGGFEENLVTGEITWSSQVFALHGLPPGSSPVPLERLHRNAHPDDVVAVRRFVRTLLHSHRSASTAFRLRREDGVVRHIRVIAEPVTDSAGDLLAVRGAYQDVSAQHWTEVALAATRDQLADTEERVVERNRLALQLQQAIMPPVPAPIDTPGLRVAVRYRPAEKEHLVGGDWYDAVVLPSQHILLTVGDIAGHGIEAATGMVVLRNALRGLAATGAGPAQLLAWLNTVAHHLAEQITATAVCGLYSPQTGVLRWARAGHLAPLLVRDSEARSLPLPRGMLLGALPDATYEEQRLTLASGDRLLLYTDGLIERRGVSVDNSMEQLVALASGPLPDLDEQLDRLLTHSRSDTDDDTCLIGLQVH